MHAYRDTMVGRWQAAKSLACEPTVVVTVEDSGYFIKPSACSHSLFTEFIFVINCPTWIKQLLIVKSGLSSADLVV